jgi:hypothetical protein
MADDELAAAPDPGGRALRWVHKALMTLVGVALVLYGIVLLPSVAALLNPQMFPSAAQYEHLRWSLLTLVGLVVTLIGVLYLARPALVPSGWPSSPWPRLPGIVGMWSGVVLTWYAATAALVGIPPFGIFLVVGSNPVFTLPIVAAVLRRRERRNAAREEARGG